MIALVLISIWLSYECVPKHKKKRRVYCIYAWESPGVLGLRLARLKRRVVIRKLDTMYRNNNKQGNNHNNHKGVIAWVFWEEKGEA